MTRKHKAQNISLHVSPRVRKRERSDLVHVQSGFDHLLIFDEVGEQVPERGDEHGLQQNLVAACNTRTHTSEMNEDILYRVGTGGKMMWSNQHLQLQLSFAEEMCLQSLCNES